MPNAQPTWSSCRCNYPGDNIIGLRSGMTPRAVRILPRKHVCGQTVCCKHQVFLTSNRLRTRTLTRWIPPRDGRSHCLTRTRLSALEKIWRIDSPDTGQINGYRLECYNSDHGCVRLAEADGEIRHSSSASRTPACDCGRRKDVELGRSVLVRCAATIRCAEVAQLVEHSPEKAGVDSSILSLGTTSRFRSILSGLRQSDYRQVLLAC